MGAGVQQGASGKIDSETSIRTCPGLPMGGYLLELQIELCDMSWQAFNPLLPMGTESRIKKRRPLPRENRSKTFAQPLPTHPGQHPFFKAQPLENATKGRNIDIIRLIKIHDRKIVSPPRIQ